MSEIKLKPCPFCGGKAEMIARGVLYCVTCSKCDCKGDFLDTPAAAAKVWNRRADLGGEPKLLPCPFCDAQAVEVWGVDAYRVMCTKCYSKTEYHDTPQLAANTWNRRV